MLSAATSSLHSTACSAASSLGKRLTNGALCGALFRPGDEPHHGHGGAGRFIPDTPEPATTRSPRRRGRRGTISTYGGIIAGTQRHRRPGSYSDASTRRRPGRRGRMRIAAIRRLASYGEPEGQEEASWPACPASTLNRRTAGRACRLAVGGDEDRHKSLVPFLLRTRRVIARANSGAADSLLIVSRRSTLAPGSVQMCLNHGKRVLRSCSNHHHRQRQRGSAPQDAARRRASRSAGASATG